MVSADGVDPRYFAEQAILLFFYTSLFILFVLELLVELKLRHQAKQEKKRQQAFATRRTFLYSPYTRLLTVGTLQYTFHRLGIIVTLLQILRFVDPHNLYGIYDRRAVLFFSNNITALIIIASCSAFYMPLNLVFHVSFHRNAPTRVKVAFGINCFMTVLAANVVLLSTADGSNTGYLLWLSFAEIANISFFNWGIYRLKLAIEDIQFHPPTSPRSPRINKQPSQLTYQGVARDTSFSTNASGLAALPAKRAERVGSGALRETSFSANPGGTINSMPVPIDDEQDSGDGNVPVRPNPTGSPVLAAVAAPAANGETAGPKTPRRPSFSYSASASGKKDPPSRDDIDRPMQQMTRFQIAANIISFASAITQIAFAAKTLSSDDRDHEARSSPESYVIFDTGDMGFVILQFLAALIMFWYAYMPLNVLWDPSPVPDEPAPGPRSGRFPNSNARNSAMTSMMGPPLSFGTSSEHSDVLPLPSPYVSVANNYGSSSLDPSRGPASNASTILALLSASPSANGSVSVNTVALGSPSDVQLTPFFQSPKSQSDLRV